MLHRPGLRVDKWIFIANQREFQVTTIVADDTTENVPHSLLYRLLYLLYRTVVLDHMSFVT